MQRVVKPLRNFVLRLSTGYEPRARRVKDKLESLTAKTNETETTRSHARETERIYSRSQPA